MIRLLFVILLAGTLLADGLAPASPAGPIPRPGSRAVPALAQVDKGDACPMLPDDDLLRVTKAPGVLRTQPGPLPGLDAGCTWELGAPGEEFPEWTIFLSLLTTGGRAWFDLYASEEGAGEPIAGIGDAALLDGNGGVIAVKGDTFVMVTVIGPFPRSEDAARRLAWRLMSRLEAVPAASPTPAPSTTPRPIARDLAIRLRAPGLTAETGDAAVEVLARSGIATYATPDAVAPLSAISGAESPLMLLRDQVRAMALEAWAGGGFLGRDLDPLVPTDADLALPSWVLAGYVAAAETEGAQVALGLMGDQDWSDPSAVVFPQLVLALFTSDVARERMAEAGVSTVPRVTRGAALAVTGDVQTAQGGLCTAASGFLDGALARVFDALRLGEPGGGTTLTAIWNFVVSIAESAVRAIVKEFTQQVLDLIGRVAAMAGLVATIVSAVRPWTVTVTVEPPVTMKSVGGAPGQPGALVARVDLGRLDAWPPMVEDCARVAGRPLPNLKPEGATITWTPITQSPEGLVAEGQRAARLDARGVGRFEFVTLSDFIDPPWTLYPGHVTVGVTIERPQLDQLANLALDELFGELGRARGIIEPYLRPVLQELTGRLGRLIASSGSGIGTVIYRLPEETPEPSRPPGTPTPTEPPYAVMVRVERPQIGAAEAGTILELVSCSGPYGPWSGVLRFGGIDAGEGLAVPWAELPVAFSLGGTGGIRRAFTTVTGVIPSNIEAITYDIDVFLEFTVDGSTMEILGRVNIAEQISDEELMRGSEAGEPLSRPIERAPAGRCP